MEKRKRRKKKIRLSDLPQKTMIGLLCGIFSIISLIIIVTISTINKGNAGIFVGIVGMVAFAVNIVGMTMTIKGIKENENMFFTLPLLGLLFNGIMLLVYFILYIIGLF